MRVIKTLDELDVELLKLHKAAQVSDDELRTQFQTFRMEYCNDVASDPYSQEYKDQQFGIYERISGRKYSTQNEHSNFVSERSSIPFPYTTGSCPTVGKQLMAIGFLISVMKLNPGARLIEFGPGWGNVTLALAMMGFHVTAVDIEKNFCHFISKRAESLGVCVNVVNDDFSWIDKLSEPVDAILFFESFHHASDHLTLLKSLSKATTASGRVYFGAEPIVPDFPIPWGLRMDGESLWQISQRGWLELGFNEDYFLRTLDSLGWIAEKHFTDLTPWGTVFEARKVRHADLVQILPSELIEHSSRRVIFSNWSVPEEKHRWSSGKSSKIVFAVNNEMNYYGKLTIKVGSLGKQRCDIILNNHKIDSRVINCWGTELVISFDPSLLLKSEQNELCFELPDARKPDNGDNRVLALAIFSFSFQ